MRRGKEIENGQPVSSKTVMKSRKKRARRSHMQARKKGKKKKKTSETDVGLTPKTCM